MHSVFEQMEIYLRRMQEEEEERKKNKKEVAKQ
jgi:hypothetical protein